MGKTAKTLTIADSGCATGKRCTMAQVTELAGLLYGAPPTSIAVVKNHADLVQVLADLESLAGPIYSVTFEGRSAVPSLPNKRPDRPLQPSTLPDAGSLPSR